MALVAATRSVPPLMLVTPVYVLATDKVLMPPVTVTATGPKPGLAPARIDQVAPEQRTKDSALHRETAKALLVLFGEKVD